MMSPASAHLSVAFVPPLRIRALYLGVLVLPAVLTICGIVNKRNFPHGSDDWFGLLVMANALAFVAGALFLISEKITLTSENLVRSSIWGTWEIRLAEITRATCRRFGHRSSALLIETAHSRKWMGLAFQVEQIEEIVSWIAARKPPAGS